MENVYIFAVRFAKSVVKQMIWKHKFDVVQEDFSP
jgi:hypothetical protein